VTKICLRSEGQRVHRDEIQHRPRQPTSVPGARAYCYCWVARVTLLQWVLLQMAEITILPASAGLAYCCFSPPPRSRKRSLFYKGPLRVALAGVTRRSLMLRRPGSETDLLVARSLRRSPCLREKFVTRRSLMLRRPGSETDLLKND
jgi:hypothetical protein